jgi:hypothetical protein
MENNKKVSETEIIPIVKRKRGRPPKIRPEVEKLEIKKLSPKKKTTKKNVLKKLTIEKIFKRLKKIFKRLKKNLAWIILSIVIIISSILIIRHIVVPVEIEIQVEEKVITKEVKVFPMSRDEINECILQHRDKGNLNRIVHFYAEFFPEEVRMRKIPQFDARGDSVLVTLYQRVHTQNMNAEEFKQQQLDKGLFGPKSTYLYNWMKKCENIEESYMSRFELTQLIISAGIVYDIPLNILMAIVIGESHGDPLAFNGHNQNGSNDVGLMQLNSRTFPNIDRYDARENLKGGCQYLREKYEFYGNWEMAIARYNGTGDAALEHLSKVLDAERMLDREFMNSDLPLINRR